MNAYVSKNRIINTVLKLYLYTYNKKNRKTHFINRQLKEPPVITVDDNSSENWECDYIITRSKC